MFRVQLCCRLLETLQIALHALQVALDGSLNLLHFLQVFCLLLLCGLCGHFVLVCLLRQLLNHLLCLLLRLLQELHVLLDLLLHCDLLRSELLHFVQLFSLLRLSGGCCHFVLYCLLR